MNVCPQSLTDTISYLSQPDALPMPKTIVIGIPNTKQTRDLTPTSSPLNYEGEPDHTTYGLSRVPESIHEQVTSPEHLR